MPTNWTVPTGNDLFEVLSNLVVKDSDGGLYNQDQAQDPVDGLPADGDLPTRRDAEVALVVEELRGAIRATGRFPLSLTAGAVPPEARVHVLAKAAYQLATSTPSLKLVLLTEKGAVSPFKQMYDAACAYIRAISAGNSLTEPSDPTGRDYQTAPSDTNLAVIGVGAGAIVGAYDLSTE